MKCLLLPLAALLLTSLVPLRADELEQSFANPPPQARLRAYWWWLNGNVTREAITKDLQWMKRIGMGGGLVFDAGGATQGGHDAVPAGPLFGSPPWRKLFQHTLHEADRLGLEIGMNLQSGWNLGGPMVTPERAAKVITWSQLSVTGPANLAAALPKPKLREDFYRDSFVLAYRLKPGAAAGTPPPAVTTSSWQKGMSSDAIVDGNPDTYWVSDNPPTPQKPEWVRLSYAQPVTLGGVKVQGRPGYGPRDCQWQVSEDEKKFTTLETFTVANKKDATIRFAPVKAPEFRLLIRSSYDPRQPNAPRNVQIAEIVPLDAEGKPLTASGRSRPIRQLAQKCAYHELGGSATDCSPLLDDDPATPGEEDVLAQDVLDLTGKLGADGTLRWTVPEGAWVILRFGYTNNGARVSTASSAWHGLVLDYLDAEALRWYWHDVIDPIITGAGPLCGKVWKMVQTDSWELGGVNWTATFPQEFQKRRGYDLRPWLPVIAGRIVQSRDASNRFLNDFRRTIADCVADNHYGTMAALAHQHGLGIQPESAGPHTAPLDGLKCYGRSEWPMSEFWAPSPHRPTDETRFFVKQAASAAHIYGKTVVCAEGFTSIGPQWNDILWSSQKPSFDHEACAGLNLVFWHAFTCSPQEMGLPGQEYFAGTHFNPQITWANQAHAYVSYLNRCQVLLQQGRFVADVLYYYGNHVPNIARLKKDDPAHVLPQYDYDVINEEVLLQASVKDGRVSLPSGMSYRVLVLPNLKGMSLEVARKLGELVAAGATVVGPKPDRTTGQQDDGELKRIAGELWDRGKITPRTAREAVGVPADVEGIADWIHRRSGDADIYFLCNQQARASRHEISFRVTGKQPEFWDAVSGQRYDAAAFTQKDGRTIVPLELPPFGSMFVIFRRPATVNGTGHNGLLLTPVAELTGPWDVAFGKEKRTLEKLVDWTTRPEVRYFSGTATYRKVFDLPSAALKQRLYLDLGALSMLAEVRLNGKNLGVVWTPPFRLDITGAVKPSGNALEVDVVNGWWNQLVGDPKHERTQTNIRLKPGAEPQESGLLGPVTIQAAEGTSSATR
jgi:hypothetical protein